MSHNGKQDGSGNGGGEKERDGDGALALNANKTLSDLTPGNPIYDDLVKVVIQIRTDQNTGRTTRTSAESAHIKFIERMKTWSLIPLETWLLDKELWLEFDNHTE